MEFYYSTYRIKLRHTFTIARSSHDYYDIIFVYLTVNGITGLGEAVPADRYDEPFPYLLDIVRTISLEDLSDSGSLDKLLDRILPKCAGCRTLEAAFDVAAHDLWGKLNKTSISGYFGADPSATPLTSFTIGIDDPDVIEQKVEEAEPYPVLKVKLGTEDDRKIINTIRNLTDKLIRVDANEGWDLKEALRMCEWLSKKNIEFVEQPLSSSNLHDTARLKEQSPLKLIADESCLDSGDIADVANAFHGINIKLVKCGGLREAGRMIELARKHDLEIMLGCMIETSLLNTAAAHLSPLVDYADLDGHLLIDNDPFDGLRVEKGKLILPDGPGLGVRLR